MSKKITVNGKEQSIEVDGNMPLLWYLRDEMDYTGTKFGCGMGLCGACTVHIDGKAVRSCITPVSQALDKQVTTIEGLSEKGDHPLQEAWVEHKVPQCGYCQAGQIMNAASMLKDNPKPTAEEIEQGMQGNICRCGTYNRIKKAIASAADKMQEV